jgi:hypothetical protein
MHDGTLVSPDLKLEDSVLARPYVKSRDQIQANGKDETLIRVISILPMSVLMAPSKGQC